MDDGIVALIVLVLVVGGIFVLGVFVGNKGQEIESECAGYGKALNVRTKYEGNKCHIRLGDTWEVVDLTTK
ncbi:hypothetical protein LJC19_07000 [Oxalobacter sp. OttesenSCG-928-P03]|nr:hypothetical protein [Oxalobacter sp. OttesenSCG-928-P03]